MSTIEELKARVEQVEQRFGLISEQNQHYSDRLIGLIAAVEDGLNRRQALVEELEVRLARAAHENEALREMLHALLLAVEDNGRAAVAAAMQDLESRIAALLGADAAVVADEVAEVGADVAIEDATEEAMIDGFEIETEPVAEAADFDVEPVTESGDDSPETEPVPDDAGDLAAAPEPVAEPGETEPAVAELAATEPDAEPLPDQPEAGADAAVAAEAEPADNGVETLIDRIRAELETEVETEVTPQAVEDILRRMRAEEAHGEAEPVAATG